jgi:hypothetical protein
MTVEIMQKVVDKLPNEVDESTDPNPPPPQEIIKQAASDLKRGLVDTDRGAAVDLTYKKQKRTTK